MERLTTAVENVTPLLSEAILAGGRVKLIISGVSMYPMLLHRRDSVILESFDKLRRKDVLLYKTDRGYVLHRIVKIKKGELYLAGDSQLEIEHPIYQEQGIAVVTAFYRNGKYVSCRNILYVLYSEIWGCWIGLRPLLFVLFKKLNSLRRKFKGERKNSSV